MTPIALPRRTLRSGKEFSAFDLALGRAITPPVPFDFGVSLEQRLSEQEAAGLWDEDHAEDHAEPPADTPDSPPLPPPTPSPPQKPSGLHPATLSAKDRDKQKSKARRDKKRQQARLSAGTPLKSVHRKHVQQAKASALDMDLDASSLPHSKPAWVGSRAAEDEPFDFEDAAAPHDGGTGLGGVSYTQEEVDALSGTRGFRYIGWLGELTVPVVDRQRRVVITLGGMPRDRAGWKTVTDGAAALLRERLSRLRLSDERLHHRRALDSFPALARGWSHGGGQTEPGELCNNVTNTQATDELLAHPYFRRLALFANILFAMWAPMLFAFYTTQMALLAAWKPMRKNFAGSVFAACTFNFGPRAICVPHLDYANLSWGWCAITALGDFDPDLGGHLILWDLRLVIRFPPGSTILLPSAVIRHSNVPVRAHEYRASFVQYTAGGLFRWVRNGFQTDENWERSASKEQKKAREEENKRRWEEGMNMYSVLDEL
ncbi:hypothetical protein B0H14DRAFT_3510661 [Mycena olivaceomarginata]|nr:hypothetical protein B0H14DRAFT_3510661 [Mycena olivaceomarginata]